MESYRALQEKLKDPCCHNRTDLYTQLFNLWKNLLAHHQISYYCSQCHYTHRQGRIYQDHLPHAQYIPPTPPITPISYEFSYIEKVIGIYRVGRQSYWQRIPKYHPLTFHLTPKCVGEVGVFFKQYLLGYLKKKQRPNWKHLLESGIILEGNLMKYFPRKQLGDAPQICLDCEERIEHEVLRENQEIRYFSCQFDQNCEKKKRSGVRYGNTSSTLRFRPPYAKVRITGFHPQKSLALVKNLFSLIKINYPQIENALLALGSHEQDLLLKIIDDNNYYPHLTQMIRHSIERKVKLANGYKLLL